MGWICRSRFARVTPVSSHASKPKADDSRFVELDVLRNAEKMKSVITQRLSNNMITFVVVREYERDGVVESTGFIPETLIDPFLALVELTKKRIAELRASGKAQPSKIVTRR